MALKGKEGQLGLCGCRRAERQSVKEHVKKNLERRRGQKKDKEPYGMRKGENREIMER